MLNKYFSPKLLKKIYFYYTYQMRKFIPFSLLDAYTLRRINMHYASLLKKIKARLINSLGHKSPTKNDDDTRKYVEG